MLRCSAQAWWDAVCAGSAGDSPAYSAGQEPAPPSPGSLRRQTCTAWLGGRKVALSNIAAPFSWKDAVKNGTFSQKERKEKKKKLLQVDGPQFRQTGIVFFFSAH